VEVINLQIVNDSINFGPVHGSYPQVQTKDIGFGLFNFTKAIVVLTGTDFGYSQSSGDHHLGTVTIKVDSTIVGNVVRVTATLGVRDWSGTIDDDYDGNVYFAVIAE
jgi:hypothetical protein